MNGPTMNADDLQARLRELTERSLSPIGRYAHVALLLAAIGVGVVVLALLLTEPALPLRTRAAFLAMLAVAGGWIGYAIWVLRHRRPLLARHRVVAGGLATAFSGLFAAGAATAALVSSAPAANAAAALGVPMLLLAVAVRARAVRRHRALTERRRALEQQLAEAESRAGRD